MQRKLDVRQSETAFLFMIFSSTEVESRDVSDEDLME